MDTTAPVNVIQFPSSRAGAVKPPPPVVGGAAAVKPTPPALDLKLGSRGPVVASLKENLCLWGFDPGSEGDAFDESTAASVRALQRKIGVKPTGEIDRATAKVFVDAANGLAKEPAADRWLRCPNPQCEIMSACADEANCGAKP